MNLRKFNKDVVELLASIIAILKLCINNLFLRDHFLVFRSFINAKYYNYASKTCRIGKRTSISSPVTCIKGNVSIGSNSHLGRYAVLTTWRTKENVGRIVMGDGVRVGDYCHFSSANEIIVEDGVLMGRFVSIVDNSHGVFNKNELSLPPSKRPIVSKGKVRICKNVWIGDKVTICPNVTIGESTIIGANSVVTKDVPPFSVAAGNPCSVIKVINNEYGA